jgi:hypothetical protein
LFSTIAGWSETFPQFKTGAIQQERMELYLIMILEGIMFIPSGLGYYFEVLVFRPIHLGFSFKLFELQRLDQDGDGIPSYLERI